MKDSLIYPAGISDPVVQDRLDTNTMLAAGHPCVADLMIDTRTGQSLRVIEAGKQMITVFELTEGKGFHFISYTIPRFLDLCRAGDLIFGMDEVCIAIGEVPEKYIRAFTTKKAFVTRIYNAFRGRWTSLEGYGGKTLIEPYIKDSNLKKETAILVLHRYLSSGCRDYSLISKRTGVLGSQKRGPYTYTSKPGRPITDERIKRGVLLTPEVRAAFEDARQKMLQTPSMTCQYAYRYLLKRYYLAPDRDEPILGADDNLVHISSCPTYKQFWYYCRTHADPEHDDIARLGEKEVRNRLHREHSGNAFRIKMSGELIQIDAWEADMSLTSSHDSNQSIGRAIVYAAVDTISSKILAVYVGLDNNHVLSLTSLFMALAVGTSPSKYCTCYTTEPRMLPQMAMTDRGADFISDAFDEVCRRLEIRHDFAPPATGVAKPKVERFFGWLAEKQEVVFDKKGRITKAYNSNHHKESRWCLEDYLSFVVRSVDTHNRCLLTDLMSTPDMIDKGIEKSPDQLWDYYLSDSYPRMITDLQQYLFDLMPAARVSITQRGIMVNGLPYIAEDDKDLMDAMYLHKKGCKIDIRYDPRCMDYVYYTFGDEIRAAHLNTKIPGIDQFVGMPYSVVRHYRHEDHVQNVLGSAKNDSFHVGQTYYDEKAIKAAEKNTPTRTTGMREARRIEQYDTQAHTRMSTHMDLPPIAAQDVIDSDSLDSDFCDAPDSF